MKSMPWWRLATRWAAGLLLGLVCLAATACGGSGEDATDAAAATTAAGSTATTASSQACADAAALRAAVTDLDQIDVPGTGKAEIQTALQDIRTKLDALRSSGTQWGTQIDELRNAIDDLQTTIGAIDGDNLLTQVPTIISDLEQIDQAWTSLQEEIDQACSES